MFVFVGGECNVRLALASGSRIILNSAFQFPRHHNTGKYNKLSYRYIYGCVNYGSQFNGDLLNDDRVWMT